MSESQIEGHVGRLNLGDRRSVSAEWEVVLINSFSKFGSVEHEPNLGGTSSPDLFVSTPGVKPFAADIASVSDAGYENDNPIRYFETAFERLVRSKGIGLGGFYFDFGSKETGEYPEQKTQLLLPPKPEIDHFVKDNFAGFIEAIAREPGRTHRHSYRDSRADISVTYDPANTTISGAHYPSYTAVKDLEKNSLYNALSSKASQLKNSGFEGTKGVIVCDGGASYLSDAFGSATSFGLKKIIANFFRKHSSVSFVMVVRTLSRDSSLRRDTIQLSCGVFLNGHLPDTPNGERLIEVTP